MKTLIVTTISTPEETFAGALGITKQREALIDALMDKCHIETDTYPGAIAAMSRQLQNANELAYAAFHLGAFAEAQRHKGELLEKLLNG